MAPLYARYVPPRLADAVSSPAPIPQSSDQPVQRAEQEGGKKRKRSEEEVADRKARKASKRKGEITSENTGAGAANAEVSQLHGEVTHSSDHVAVSEEKRQKKDKKSRKPDQKSSEDTPIEDGINGAENGIEVAEENGEDDHGLAKHKSVLSKFQKASQRSTALQASTQDDQEDDEPTEARVLHGETIFCYADLETNSSLSQT